MTQPLRSLPDSIAIAGVGLIGGSIAAALKARGYVGRIVGIGRRLERLNAARAQGLIDEASTSITDASGCGLAVFCTPVDRIASDVLSAGPHCRPGTLLTDAGSVKECICSDVKQRLPEGVTFIGSHPLAGSEKQGFEHADAMLFENRVCVITPDKDSPEHAVERLTSFWQSLGCAVLRMTAADHDRALAKTSHAPHVLAAALASILDEANGDGATSGPLDSLAATGFRDSTRIAAGDPDLWISILLANAGHVAESLDWLGGKLGEFRSAIENRDADTLRRLLESAKQTRDRL